MPSLSQYATAYSDGGQSTLPNITRPGAATRKLQTAFLPLVGTDAAKQAAADVRATQARYGEVYPRTSSEYAMQPSTGGPGVLVGPTGGSNAAGAALAAQVAKLGMGTKVIKDAAVRNAGAVKTAGAGGAGGAGGGGGGGGGLTSFAPVAPSAGYSKTYEAALAAQRTSLEDEFRRAGEEIGRQESTRQALIPGQRSELAQQYTDQQGALTGFANSVGAAQAAAGLPSIPGSQEASLQQYLSAANLIQGGEESNIGYLSQGIGELAQKQRGGLDQARLGALNDISAQEAQYAAEMQRMQAEEDFQARMQAQQLAASAAEAAANRRAASARVPSFQEQLYGSLTPEQQAQARLASFGIAPAPQQTFGASQISAERGNAFSPGYTAGLTKYMPEINKRLPGLYQDAAGNEATFMASLYADPYLASHPAATSYALARMFGGAANTPPKGYATPTASIY